MSDDTEGSAAMLGSVAGEPVAWAVMQPDAYVVVHTRHAAVVMRETCGGGKIVPLYRSPTLTDEELRAVRRAAFAYAQNDDDEECAGIASALLGLAERCK